MKLTTVKEYLDSIGHIREALFQIGNPGSTEMMEI